MSEKKYFAASNTVGGFVSYYDEIFGKCDRVYIIKGGSGTGKSYFMRQCADHVKALAGFRDVEYFYCSFDPTSLDGIIINGSVAIIDGTAPHVYEPTLAGARENIIDLGRFWDPCRLRMKKEALSELFGKKKSCFQRAYGYLGACAPLDRVRQSIVAEYIDNDRLISAAAKLVGEIGANKKEKKDIRLTSALGREGFVKFDTYETQALKTYRICDTTGGAHMFLERVIEEANRFGVSVCVSYDPIYANRPDAVLLGDTAVTVDEGSEEDIFAESLRKGFSSEKDRIERIKELQSSLISEATKELRRAAEVHFLIEEIYVDAMDFRRKEEFAEKFLSALTI